MFYFVKRKDLVITHMSEHEAVAVFSLNRKEREGRKETPFLILFALFACFAVRCG